MKAGARPHRMTARAASVASTAAAIMDATWELFEEKPLAGITLADIAARSGVTVQTALRRFGDKDGVFAAMFDKFGSEVARRRDQAHADAIDDVVATLVRNYELSGRITLKMLAEETAAPAVRDILAAGRQREWCATAFSGTLAGLSGTDRDRRLGRARRDL